MKRFQIATFLVLALVSVHTARAQSSTPQTPQTPQVGCPLSNDFGSALSSSTVLTAPMDPMWNAADLALRRWADSVFFVRPYVRRRNSALSDAPSPSVAQTAASNEKVTCFFERRNGKRDSRIAFRLVATTVKGSKSPSTRLVVYRLSQTKGSVQKTWTLNQAGSDVLASQFIDLLREQLRTVARR
jgi:hypothetical protein